MSLDKINETISSYFKDKKEIVAIYLFGSHAANKERYFSDIDIAIVAEYYSINVVKKNVDGYLLGLSKILRKDIHITILNTASENLLFQVFKKGECLVVNNRKALSSFKMKAYTKIADFSYHKEMMQQGFLNRMMEV
jgi:predicted nucleotidyltransferase